MKVTRIAGLPGDVPAATVNRLTTSGRKIIAQRIQPVGMVNRI
ncbi:MAG: hypothetical protein KatS3mg016_1031 [Fimbriimonadales bacterium]|nr:MAG: hypothetical protein KatS3mg016_1031 [Fimbriimonadales bacterium]